MTNKCGDGVVGGKGGGGIQQPSGQTNRVPPLSNPGILFFSYFYLITNTYLCNKKQTKNHFVTRNKIEM